MYLLALLCVICTPAIIRALCIKGGGGTNN